MKRLLREEGSDLAAALMARALEGAARLASPAWSWAELGTVLLRRVGRGEISSQRARALWREFIEFPVTYVDGAELRDRAWSAAERHRLSSLYDATFLACAELTGAEYWTADAAFIRHLGRARPRYVRELGS